MSERKREDRDYIDDWFAHWYGNRLGNASRRKQGALLGGAVATLLILLPVGVRSSIDSERQQDAIKQEQKAQDRVDQLAKKYDVSHLSKESQDAFWRLVELTPFDIGDTEAMYQDSEQTGEWLQQDTAVLNAALVNNGEITNEYDLAAELIPAATQEAMKEAGFEFTPLEPPYCDAGSVPTYRPFDYSNHLPKDLKITYVKRKDGAIVRIPLGTKQMPAPPEDYSFSDYPFSRLNWINISSKLDTLRRDSGESQTIRPDRFYKIAGCQTLPRGDYWAKIKQVY